MEVSSRAFILRTYKHSEADLIVHLLENTGRKLSLMARGALKSRKRFGGGVLEPANYVQIQFRWKGEESLGVLAEAQLLNGFEGLRSDYDRIQGALYFVRLIDQLSLVGDLETPALFDLLGNTLRAAETTSDLQKLRTHFEIKLLHNQGILPHWPGVESFLSSSVKDHQTLESESWNLFQSETRRLLQDYTGTHKSP